MTHLRRMTSFLLLHSVLSVVCVQAQSTLSASPPQPRPLQLAADTTDLATLATSATEPTDHAMMSYERPGHLEMLPPATASLYRTPWRSNLQTVAAWRVLQGVGVYYKHLHAHPNVMKQLAAAGVQRIRLAPHHAMYIHPDWTGPTEDELNNLRLELKYAHQAGLRPCVTFVHIPPVGTGTQMQEWVTRPWNKGLMPLGDGPNSPQARAYLDKLYLALQAILDAAREAGFTQSDSYDIEMGCNLWWGAPALPANPHLTLDMLQPGGQVYESQKALITRAREEGYVEPTMWNGMGYHYFEKMSDAENFPGTVGRAISIYSQSLGQTDGNFTGSDVWPLRPALKFLEGQPPLITLCRPESFASDMTRRDNMIQLLQHTNMPVAITSLGVVPADIPGTMVNITNEQGQTVKIKAPGVDGWLMKTKAVSRSLAFWLNQGADFVLLHSAYEGADDEMSHALIPDMGKDWNTFRWEQSRPLTALHHFRAAFAGAKPIQQTRPLTLSYRMHDDPILIPPTGDHPPLKASDALALLPFQVNDEPDHTQYVLAAYVVTPNIAQAMTPVKMKLQISGQPQGEITLHRPTTASTALLIPVGQSRDHFTIEFEVLDDVQLIQFTTKK